VAAHPGWAKTELQRHASGLLGLFMTVFGPILSQGPGGGATPLLRAATDPAVQGGEYYGPSGFQEFKGSPVRVQSNPLSHDVELQQRLWRRSEQDTGVVYAI
jgi:hypothetical protein